LSSSLFIANLDQITIDSIEEFCTQSFPEGLRLDYKRDLIQPYKLARTICAFANTQGGLLLIGIDAEKKTNTPHQITGIDLKQGLEEHVINVCYTHIAPVITPEVKICPLKSDPAKAVLFIRVDSSYYAPHYLLKTNKIPIRVHSTIRLVDLPTIETLLDQRDEESPYEYNRYPETNAKFLTIENDVVETVIIVPQLRNDRLITFTKANNGWLFNTFNQQFTLYDRAIKNPYELQLLSKNADDKIRRYCIIRREGEITFQRPVNISRNQYFAEDTIAFLFKMLKIAQQVYPHFSYYGELAIGLTMANMSNIPIKFQRRRVEYHECQANWVKIYNNFRFDALSNMETIVETMFEELCLYFNLELEKTIIQEIVADVSTKIQ
jgi:hypothetical protein